LYPIVMCSPASETPSLTIVTYGGISSNVLEALHDIFQLTGLIPELIVLSKISPLNINPVLESVRITRRIITIEEGSKEFGIGAEIITQTFENLGSQVILARRIAAKPVPIPSARSTEDWVLPNNRIVENILKELSL